MKKTLRNLTLNLTALTLLHTPFLSFADHGQTQAPVYESEVGCFPEAESAAARLKQVARHLLQTIRRYEINGETDWVTQRAIRVFAGIEEELETSCELEGLLETKDEVRIAVNCVRQALLDSPVLSEQPDAISVLNRLITYARRYSSTVDAIVEEEETSECSRRARGALSDVGQRLAVLSDVADALEHNGRTELLAHSLAIWIQQQSIRLEQACTYQTLITVRDAVSSELERIQEAFISSPRLPQNEDAVGANQSVLVAFRRLEALTGSR